MTSKETCNAMIVYTNIFIKISKIRFSVNDPKMDTDLYVILHQQKLM